MAAIQCRLDREGGTKLFTDLVMSSKNEKIFQESIQLAICLLEGGNTEIQVAHLDLPDGRRAKLETEQREKSNKINEMNINSCLSAELLLQTDDGRQQVGEVLQGS